jgi:hypothetical protein
LSSEFILFFKLFCILAENNLMSEYFWDRIKKLLSTIDKPDIWLIKGAGLGKTAIINGQTKKTSPSVDIAYRCAKVLRTTVEELVDGDTGEQYLREYIRDKGWQFFPPERIADIVQGLSLLDDNELEMIRGAVVAAAERKKGTGTGTDGHHG